MNTTAQLLHVPCTDCGHPAYQHRETSRVRRAFRCTFPVPGGSPFIEPCDCPKFLPPDNWGSA